MNYLGELYLYGKGNVGKNYDKALSLFKRSAAAHAQSAVNLGKMYFCMFFFSLNTPIKYLIDNNNNNNNE